MAMLSTASTGTLHKFCQCLHNEEEGEEGSAHDPVTPIDAMPSIYMFPADLRQNYVRENPGHQICQCCIGVRAEGLRWKMQAAV